MIKFYDESKKFKIDTQNASYCLEIDEEGVLRNLYWGEKITDCSDVKLEIPTIEYYYSVTKPYREEFISKCRTTLDEPCLLPEFSDGTRDVRLFYSAHTISDFEDGQELIITLRDEFYPLEVDLKYRTYGNLDLISKNAVIRNNGKTPIKLTKFKSGTMYTAWGKKMRLMYMAGRWGREYQKEYIEISKGRFVLDGHRGTASGPNFVPFFALDEGEATETIGNVWFGSLHWSGNFKIEFEYPYTNQLCVTAGANDFDCEIELNENAKYETPILTIGFSNSGYEKMSELLYDFQFDYLSPQTKIKKDFPIIYNSWYPYELDINEEKCLAFIDRLKDIGAELFVIDDGWFMHRDDFDNGLGDWECDKNKFPNGLKIISDKAHENNLLFGLWVEPEMVNEKSDLFKKHPEWVLEFPNRSRTKTGHRCVLNLARDDVYEFVWKTVDKMISEYNLDYLKWDMNTYIYECGNATYNGNQKEIWIKFIENLYKIWDKMNVKYPNVLFECCAHGGARSDYGMVKYSDRINRSDNADPIDVLKLHEGFTTYLLPKYAGGAGNISPSPNNINNRYAPLEFRAFLGMTGSMSVGINLLKSSDDEIKELKKYLSDYKRIRHITQSAYVYRISSAFENNYVVWEYLKRDRKQAIVFIFAHSMNFRDIPPRIRLRGLDKHKQYKVNGKNLHVKGCNDNNEEYTSYGDALMNFGLFIHPVGDFHCQIISIEEV